MHNKFVRETVLIQDGDGHMMRVNVTDLKEYLVKGYEVAELEEVAEPAPATTGKEQTTPEVGFPSLETPPGDLPDDGGIHIADIVFEGVTAAGFGSAQKILGASDEALLAIKGVGDKTLEDLRTWAQMVVDQEAAQEG